MVEGMSPGATGDVQMSKLDVPLCADCQRHHTWYQIRQAIWIPLALILWGLFCYRWDAMVSYGRMAGAAAYFFLVCLPLGTAVGYALFPLSSRAAGHAGERVPVWITGVSGKGYQLLFDNGKYGDLFAKANRMTATHQELSENVLEKWLTPGWAEQSNFLVKRVPAVATAVCFAALYWFVWRRLG